MTPKAVELFEAERNSLSQSSSMIMEHPLDRLKFFILKTGGKIVKSEFSMDGTAYVVWECAGCQYRAWSAWPDHDYAINWKQTAQR